MIQAISEYIKNIAMFLILQSLINLIVPSEKFKGYISMMMGFILVLLIISPINQLLGLKEQTPADMIQLKSYELSQNVFKNETNSQSDYQNELIMATYKQNLKEHIQNTLAKENEDFDLSIELDVEEDASSHDFGKIKNVTVNMHKKENKNMIIEPVMVQLDKPIKTNSDDESTNHIKNLIKNFYNLSDDNIHIIVQVTTE